MKSSSPASSWFVSTKYSSSCRSLRPVIFGCPKYNSDLLRLFCKKVRGLSSFLDYIHLFHLSSYYDFPISFLCVAMRLTIARSFFSVSRLTSELLPGRANFTAKSFSYCTCLLGDPAHVLLSYDNSVDSSCCPIVACSLATIPLSSLLPEGQQSRHPCGL